MLQYSQWPLTADLASLCAKLGRRDSGAEGTEGTDARSYLVLVVGGHARALFVEGAVRYAAGMIRQCYFCFGAHCDFPFRLLREMDVKIAA